MSDPIGSVAWLERTGGRLSLRDRLALIAGMFGAVREGLRLGRRARHGGTRDAPLALFEPPQTPMVAAARAHLEASCGVALVGHSVRTAFWTLCVLHQHGGVTPIEHETAWVAALLHDVGLERPPPRGDFAAGGIAALRSLAAATRWTEEQTHWASEAIATNLSARVDPARSGRIAWAMNVGGAGELGSPGHRAQMHPDRIAELEARFPRDGFRASALRLIAAEARRVRGGRFGLFRWVFPLIVRR